MSAAGAALIWCAFPSREQALEVARTLLDERLIACANILPMVESVYRYEGAITSGAEVGVVFKTSAALLPRATERLHALHPYETPAIAGWNADIAPPAMLAWLEAELDAN